MSTDGRSLKFPNARLHLHELLSARHMSGPEALVEGAEHFGLIKEDSSASLLSKPAQYHCPCLSTTKSIVEKHFDERSDQAHLQNLDRAAIWQAIEKNIGVIDCRVDCKALGQKTCPQANSCCHKMAPIFFDILLQQLRRYS